MSILTDHARHELELAVDAGDLTPFQGYAIGQLVRATFENQGHSGGSAPTTIAYIAAVVRDAMSYEPLTPLSGDDSEWITVGEDVAGRPGLQQNCRCSRVFREPDEHGDMIAYAVEMVVWTDRPRGQHGVTGWDSSRRIEFPWLPGDERRVWKGLRWPNRWIARLRGQLAP
jgi:hypothetical protein